MDYYGFTQELYELKFNSRGDAQLSQRVVELFNQVTLSLPFPSIHSPASLFLSDFSVALHCVTVNEIGRYPRSPNTKG
jgi:hypothetical protein